MTMAKSAELHAAATGEGPPDDLWSTATAGLDGAAGPLPHLDEIQQAFGRHDVRGARAAVGGAAAEASAALNASAYAAGEGVAFTAAPGLHTAGDVLLHPVG